jgi:sRNA-binding carbon storage regulator CsrA
MLVLNRRIGQSIYLDDSVCLTVFAAQRDRILIAVIAPAAARVHSTDAVVCSAIHDAAVLDGDERPYLFALRNGQTLAIDASEIQVRFSSCALSTLRKGPGRVQLAVRAPAHVVVQREEIYAQRQSDNGRRATIASLAKRLQRANLSMARPRAAMPAWTAVDAAAPANAEFVFA